MVVHRFFTLTLAVCGLAFGQANILEAAQPRPPLTPEQQLGQRLFHDQHLSNLGSDWGGSCAACHKPAHAYADNKALSLSPDGDRGHAIVFDRNTPSLLDAASAPRLGWDGRYASLDDAIKGELFGPHMGWETNKIADALSAIYTHLVNDHGDGEFADGPYNDQLKAVYGRDVEAASPEEAGVAVLKALGEFLKNTTSTRTTPYDAFAYMNRIEKKIDIKGGDTADGFAGRLFGSLANQEGRLVLKLPAPQTVEFYEGLKIFYQYDAEAHAGNCVACHHVPLFTDDQFHNTGVTQDEYDGAHGDGAFMKMAIPSSNANGGEKTHSAATKGDPTKADLGHWNVAEGNLESAIGAFKTPGLTDVDKTAPYGHNGQYATLEDVVRQKMKASNLAREGKLRNAPEAYKWMILSEEDIAPLVTFLKAMTEVGPDHFRALVTDDVTVMKGPYPFSE